jgi:predicted ABC-type transport system involved in lysophospholipase L1 biosynthesis ATPase subunit
MSEILLEARAVERTFSVHRTDVPVLRGATLAVRRGESVAIVGASGSGKTTLLQVLGGLDRPDGGSVLFRGHDVYRMRTAGRSRLRGECLGFVFQSYHLLPELDVLENVVLPAMACRGVIRRAGEVRARARSLLQSVGLSERAAHTPLELSGGEQQRVALARALMNEPELLLADEPTGNLDDITGEQVLSHLFRLSEERTGTLVVVTHNQSIADRCDRTLRLADGVLA